MGSPFWVWTSCLKKTSSPSPVPARSNVSSRSPSKSPKFSLDTPESWSPLLRPSRDSRASCMVNTIICPKPPSTWLVPSRKLSLRLRNWLNQRRKQNWRNRNFPFNCRFGSKKKKKIHVNFPPIKKKKKNIGIFPQKKKKKKKKKS